MTGSEMTPPGPRRLDFGAERTLELKRLWGRNDWGRNDNGAEMTGAETTSVPKRPVTTHRGGSDYTQGFTVVYTDIVEMHTRSGGWGGRGGMMHVGTST